MTGPVDVPYIEVVWNDFPKVICSDSLELAGAAKSFIYSFNIVVWFLPQLTLPVLTSLIVIKHLFVHSSPLF